MRHSYDVQEFKHQFETRFLWINGFKRSVLRKRTKTALICPLTGRTWTYDQVNRESNRLARAFQAHGVGRGDVVLYALLNSAEFVFSYVACHNLRATGSPLNYRQSAGELALLIDSSAPKVLLYDHDFEEVMGEALRLCKVRPPVVVMADLWNRETAPEGAVAYRDFIREFSEEDLPLPEGSDIYDETCRFFTSGTTNLPKAVPCNDLNEVLTAHDILMHFPLNPTDVTMNLTPWFHRGGVHIGGPTPVFYCGATCVMLRDFVPRLAVQYIAQYGITYLVGVPTVVDMIARLQETSPTDTSRLKGMVVMGAPLDEKPCRRYMKMLTPNLCNGYGPTETFWNSFLRPYDLPEGAGQAGGPCTDDDVRVVKLVEDGFADPDRDMVPMDRETIGEVVIMGIAKSTLCYAGNEELTRKKFHDGWLYTGDLATWDEKGYITIIGRKDDMIVSSGENIYPVQVEAILNEHPKVAESLVLGLPDPKRGKVVAAFIKALDPSLTERELKQFCLEHSMLSPYKRPRIYKIVDELPHNATGKLQHKLPKGVKI